MSRAASVEFLAIFAVAGLTSCGKIEGDGSPSASGGAPVVFGTGGEPQAGDANTAANTGGTSVAGTGSSAGSVGSGGAAQGGTAGEPSGLPPATPQEAEILGPLFADDSIIENATGAELVEVARSIGLAHGYAECRCAFTPSGPPSGDNLDFTLACAEDSFGGLSMLEKESSARCIAEDMATVPAFELYLHCLVTSMKWDGNAWLRDCGTDHLPVNHVRCRPFAEGEALIQACGLAFYCEDGTRVNGHACDGVADCADRSDESSCAP